MSEDREIAWLHALKAGDSVAYWYDYGRNVRIEVVRKVTPKQIVVGGDRFRRSDGRLIGGDEWNKPAINEPTPARVHQARVLSARSFLGSVRYSRLSDADAIWLAAEIESRLRS